MPGQLDIIQTAIANLKDGVRKLNSPQLNKLAEETRYIDVADVGLLTPSDIKALASAFRRRWGAPAEWHIRSEQQFVMFFAPTVDLAAEYPHTAVIAFNSKEPQGTQIDLESVLAHELGHKAMGRGYVAITGKNEESAADNFAALVTSPQRVVDMLRSIAQAWPESNTIFDLKDADPHPTAYERALAIAENFPGQVDLKDFPVPRSPPVTVHGVADPVPLVPVPLPSKLTVPHAAITPHDGGRPYRAGLRDIQASTTGAEIRREPGGRSRLTNLGSQRVRLPPPAIRIP